MAEARVVKLCARVEYINLYQVLALARQAAPNGRGHGHVTYFFNFGLNYIFVMDEDTEEH